MEIYPHEAWCNRCHVSHPPGTRRCLHCGGAVLPVRPIEGMRSSAAARVPVELPAPLDLSRGEDADDGPERPPVGKLRLGMNAVWILLFIVVTAVRVCSERG